MRALLVFLVLSLPACAEPLDPASKLLTSRVLGVYYVDDEDPSRANPRPGDGGALELFVADPAEALARSYVLLACLPSPSSFGVPFCEGAPFAFAEQTAGPGDPVEAPRLPLTVPGEAELGEAGSILVLGAVCSGGALDPELTGLLTGETEPPKDLEVCEDPSLDGTLLTFTLPIEGGEIANTHPSVEAALLDGAPFTATSPLDASMGGCEGDPAYPEIAADGAEHTLTLRVPASAREDYEVIDPETEEPRTLREELQVGRFATEGDVSGTFNWIDGDSLESVLRWEAPEEAPEGGRLVRFVFTLRDGRGGFAWARREACLVR